MRQPTTTTAECESVLGTRGYLQITSTPNGGNRAWVRKWLVAQGFDARFVGALSMFELGHAYNKTDGSGIAAIQKKWDAIPDEDKQEEPQAAQTLPSFPVNPIPADMAGDSASAIEQAIRTIAAGVVPKASGIDAEAVKAIIRAELPNLIPTTRIEIVTNGVTHDMGERPMHHRFPDLVQALACGLHVCLVGPAGSGKTTAAEMAAAALKRQFRILGGVSGEHALSGFTNAHGHYQTTPYRDAFEHGHIFIKDEIDVDDPAALLTLNAGLANGFAAFPDNPEPVMKGNGFQVVACANTWGLGADRIYVGRNQLDGATLDRFVFIDWDYDEKLEAALCGNADWLKRVQSLRHAAFAEKARIVISPRASMFGAQLLAAGMPTNKVEAMTIWKGTDSELRRRIEERAR